MWAMTIIVNVRDGGRWWGHERLLGWWKVIEMMVHLWDDGPWMMVAMVERVEDAEHVGGRKTVGKVEAV